MVGVPVCLVIYTSRRSDSPPVSSRSGSKSCCCCVFPVLQIMACVMYPPLMGLPLKWNKICTENGLAVANGLGNHCAFPHLAPEEQAIYAASQTVFPSDVLEQGRRYISGMRTIGSYTHSQGLPLFREIIARWLEERDGVPTNPDHIFLTDGGLTLAILSSFDVPNGCSGQALSVTLHHSEWAYDCDSVSGLQ